MQIYKTVVVVLLIQTKERYKLLNTFLYFVCC